MGKDWLPITAPLVGFPKSKLKMGSRLREAACASPLNSLSSDVLNVDPLKCGRLECAAQGKALFKDGYAEIVDIAFQKTATGI